ncbi:MAG: aquaporin [Bacteroidota bacterium]
MTARLLTEFIGTFFLVLTIGLTVLIGTNFAPIAIGFVLVAMVYMGGHVSGAHYNPAVTLAIWMRGKIETREVGPYMAVQVLGAMAAAFVAFVVTDSTLQVMPAAETSLFEFFLLELLFTFALVIVILNVATSKDHEGNDFYGLAIGITVMAGAFAAGPISGGAFNPAVALGPILVDAIAGDGASLSSLWMYLVATFLGGALAALVFKVQSPNDA